MRINALIIKRFSFATSSDRASIGKMKKRIKLRRSDCFKGQSGCQGLIDWFSKQEIECAAFAMDSKTTVEKVGTDKDKKAAATSKENLELIQQSFCSSQAYRWRSEVDSLNIKVRCLFTAISLLNYFKGWRRVTEGMKSYKNIFYCVMKDIKNKS